MSDLLNLYGSSSFFSGPVKFTSGTLIPQLFDLILFSLNYIQIKSADNTDQFLYVELICAICASGKSY